MVYRCLVPRFDGKSIMAMKAFKEWMQHRWFAGKSKEATINEVERGSYARTIKGNI